MLDQNQIYDNIISLYESSGMTPSRIADKSGLPLTSINRFLSGETKQPNFYSLALLIETLGGSVDDIIGMPTSKNTHQVVDSRYTQQLKEDLELERKNKKVWVIMFIVAILLFIAFMMFDLLNPSIGYIRYTKQLAAEAQTAITSIML